MARKIEDRLDRLEEKFDELAAYVKDDTAANLRKVKRQIRGLKDRSKKLKRDVSGVSKGHK